MIHAARADAAATGVGPHPEPSHSHLEPPMPETTNPQPETAHALLYRHGLPEDVIDGALCLHAQELAAQIRSVTEQLKADGVLEPDKFRPCRDAADQIDPTREGSLYAPASPSAPADRSALRDRIADAIREWHGDWNKATFAEAADAVLAVLPEPADRAAVLVDEAALIELHCPDHGPQDQDGVWMDCHCPVADDMRKRATAPSRVADEAQQDETQADTALRIRVLSEVLGRLTGSQGGDSATDDVPAATVRRVLAEILTGMQPGVVRGGDVERPAEEPTP